MTASAHLIRMQCVWRQHPPFLHARAIEIQFPIPNCPNGDNHTADQCEIYDNNGGLIDTLVNPISTKTLLAQILKYYIPDPDSPHVNIIVFRGDFMIPDHFAFMSELLGFLDQAEVGMFIGAETFGSDDQTRLPQLLSTKIVDELMVKIVVAPTMSPTVQTQMVHIFNALSQGIDAMTHITNEDGYPEPDLKRVSISFLFDDRSQLSVFEEYLRTLYDAFSGNDDVFGMFDIYLRGRTEAILQKAYEKIIEGFAPDRVCMIPLVSDKKECLIYNN